MKRTYDAAMVTAALQSLIRVAVSDAGLDGVKVTNDRPDRADDPAAAARINVFLYQVEPSTALRNVDAPTRRSADGSLIQTPKLALDLHYLVSFYGTREVSSEKLMGVATTRLHSRPMFSPVGIRDAWQEVMGDVPPEDEDLQRYLEDVPRVRLTISQFNLEELSKLWSVLFQVPYVLSIAYRAATVVLEEAHDPHEALPVLTPRLHSSLEAPPRIERILPMGPSATPIVMGATLLISGRRLARADARVVVRVDDTEVAPIKETPTELRIVLSTTALPELSAGVHELSVGLIDDGAPHAVFSNPVAFVLQPQLRFVVDGDAVANAVVSARTTEDEASADLTVRVDPGVTRSARVRLVLLRIATADAPDGGPMVELTPRPIEADADEPVVDLFFELPTLTTLSRGTYVARLVVGRTRSPVVSAPDEPHRLLPRLEVEEA